MEDKNNEFIINPETGMIVSGGQEYANTERMRNFIRRANAIRESLPPLEPDYVRLWRGNRPDETGKNPSFTNSLEGIALPFLDAYNGDLTYIDVPKIDLDKYNEKGSVSAPDSEFTVPPELAETAKVVVNTFNFKSNMDTQNFQTNRVVENNFNNPPGWKKI